MNVSEPTVNRARVVHEKGTKELIEAVERGDIAVLAERANLDS